MAGQSQGACREVNQQLFFRPEGERALTVREPYGVWGGLTD